MYYLGPLLPYRGGPQGRQPRRVWGRLRHYPPRHVSVGSTVREVHVEPGRVLGVRVRGAGDGGVRVPVWAADLPSHHLVLPRLLIRPQVDYKYWEAAEQKKTKKMHSTMQVLDPPPPAVS